MNTKCQQLEVTATFGSKNEEEVWTEALPLITKLLMSHDITVADSTAEKK